MKRQLSVFVSLLTVLCINGCDDSSDSNKAETPEVKPEPGSVDTGNDNTGTTTDPGDNNTGNTETGTSTETPEPEKKAICGNGIREAGEQCDGNDHVPATCLEYDQFLDWEEGGKPACNDDCTYSQGTCIQAYCGNGILSGSEVCDGEQGLLKSCEAFNPNKKWAAGGVPGCSNDCTAYTVGTCKLLNEHEITFMNWNVQVDYESWGGHPVDDRAKLLYNTMMSWPSRPDIFAIIEVSPNWHRPDISAYFEKMGYAWADVNLHENWVNWTDGFTCGDNNENAYNDTTTDNKQVKENHAASCVFFTDVLYQKDKFELLEADYVPLFPPTDWDGLPENCMLHIRGDFCSTYDPYALYDINKTISFAAVLREKETGQVFIAVSNHWNPNNGTTQDMPPASIFGPVADNERVRVYGAQTAAAFVKKLQAKYEGSYVLFGGDFNTVDFTILTESPSVSLILGSTVESILKTLNSFMVGDYEADRLESGFIGSHAEFAKASGLLDARTQAKNTLDDFIDNPTAIEDVIKKYTSMFSFNVIIDYTFYSPELLLRKYEVPSGSQYPEISDHAPVKTTYIYESVAK